MTKSQINKLKFSERQALVKGEPCKASWQVQTISGAYIVSCRECGTVVQSDCVPKCLMNVEAKKKL